MKDKLREDLLGKRLSLTSQEIEVYSASLIEKIKAHPKYQKSKVIGLFSAIKNEPNLFPLLQDHKIWLLPKVVGNQLIYVRYNPKNSLIKSALNILEPKEFQDESSTLDLIIIPGIGFDQKGNRLGFGKGYFDRFLSKHPAPYVIGVAYPFQIQKSIPITKGDVPVDEVLVA
ncbi:MAG: 5-formyltetrahydrofolate cyclo-ligase [Bacilli bacterium]